MARSAIIRDLANSKVDTMTAMKRAKVLFADLGNEKLLQWVSNEIVGYPMDAKLPDYRKIRGHLVGSYFKGSMIQRMEWKNVSLPLGKMPEDLKEELLTVSLREGIEALKQLVDQSKNGEQLGKMINADLFPAIAYYNDDLYMSIVDARVIVGAQFIQTVFSVIENKLIDALIVLEKEFGNLDDLDIDVSGKTEDQLKSINEKLVLLVYNDNSISIGDGNRIKDSNIVSSIT